MTTAPTLRRRLERLEAEDAALGVELIEAGHGWLRHSEIVARRAESPLFARVAANSEARAETRAALDRIEREKTATRYRRTFCR